MIYT
ncbi:hypothetical protein Lepto7375DRAFT_6430 [Leptolyngbya sp. PCC 7375]|jgi:hypothetical protein